MKKYVIIKDVVRGEYQICDVYASSELVFNFKKEYIPKKGDKTFIFPGCNIPRFKYKGFCEKNDITLVKYKERANVHFMNGDVILNYMNRLQGLNLLVKRAYFIRYLNTIISNLYNVDYTHLEDLKHIIADVDNEYIMVSEAMMRQIMYGGHMRPYSVHYDGFQYAWHTIDEKESDVENVFQIENLFSIKEDYIEDYTNIKNYNIYHENAILGKMNTELVMNEELFEGAVNLIQNNEVSNHKLLMESMCNFNFKESASYLLLLVHVGAPKMYESGIKDNINFKSFLSFFNIDLTRGSYKRRRGSRNIDYTIDFIIDNLNFAGLLTTENVKIIEKYIIDNFEKYEEIGQYSEYFEGMSIQDNTFIKFLINTPELNKMIFNNEQALLNPVIDEDPIVEQEFTVEKQQPLNNMENMPKTAQELEQEFYAKPFLMSYSGLNKLLYSPKMFYNHYILKQREDRTDTHLIDGKVIHSLLLNDGSFDENFILLPASLPSDNTRKIIDKVNEHFLTLSEEEQTKDDALLLGTYSDIILKSLKEINLHQSLKTDEQRLAKIITEETITYFQFLRIKGRRDIIDTETLKRCNESIDFLKADSRVCDLLGLYKSETENTDVFNEIELSSDVVGIDKIGLKGFADNIKIDHDNKVIFINDLKTTGKTITDFSETVKFYNYHIQAAIYTRLVKEVYKHIITPEWSVIFNFIVIDKYNQVYAFEVSTTSLATWDEELQKKLIEADWHYKNNNYNLPYSFATGLVML